MGPYCKHCDSRCFIPTTKDDFIKTDLKATCEKGILQDLDATYIPILKDNKRIFWLLEVKPYDEYSLALELVNNEPMPIEIKTSELSYIINLSNLELYNMLGRRDYYRLK
jgi:hypothetical protein